MAKERNSLFGGKNGVQQVPPGYRKVVYPNGNEGFSSGPTLGGDTVPGPLRGAPLSSKVQQTTSSKTVDRSGMNPFNTMEGNAPGVLAGNMVKQNAGRYPDSPVPGHAMTPHIDIKSKAQEVASADRELGDSPHPAGVLGRG